MQGYQALIENRSFFIAQTIILNQVHGFGNTGSGINSPDYLSFVLGQGFLNGLTALGKTAVVLLYNSD